jgi:hypothetical protein
MIFYIKHPLFKKQEAAGPDPLDVAIRRIFITLKLATKLGASGGSPGEKT